MHPSRVWRSTLRNYRLLGGIRINSVSTQFGFFFLGQRSIFVQKLQLASELGQKGQMQRDGGLP